jgi:hypothetical protein
MKPAATQRDTNMQFDGIGDGPKKGSSRFAHNQWSGHSNDGRLVNKGRGPTTGNDGSCDTPKNLSRSVTHDANRAAPTSPTPKLPAQGSIRDNINRGSQVRNPGGTTMPKKPSNPDKIRMGQSGGPGYGQTQKGSRPSTAASQSDFNYGPKSQY